MKYLIFLAATLFAGSAAAQEYFPVRSTSYATNGTTSITATIDTDQINVARLVGSTTMWIVFTSKEASSEAAPAAQRGANSMLLPQLVPEYFRVSNSTVLLIISDVGGDINISDMTR